MKNSKVRNWSEIYPQLCIFFSEIMKNIQSNIVNVIKIIA